MRPTAALPSSAGSYTITRWSGITSTSNRSARWPPSRMATVAGHGTTQAWDLGTGQIRAVADAAAEGDSVRFPLVLGPYETKVVVVGPPAGGGGPGGPEPSLVSGTTLMELDGDWTLDLNGKQMTTPLKSWEELGVQSLRGAGHISQAVHRSYSACREERVLGTRRCTRLRPGQGERGGLRSPCLATLPMGHHKQLASRQQ